ncbi:MAG: glycosyltransferase family 4 protein [Candidatus Omnitrophica bacterium]|nr:glycosyltransferase family 4 protein [Candidatus Omnitrophota bacterium]
MKRVLFLHQSWNSFEKSDWEILKRNFSAEELFIYKDILFKISGGIKKIKRCDVVYCWFAARSALLPLIFAKIFKKKIILIVGGWDCANVPEIQYGALRRGFKFFPRRVITRYIISLADRIVAVSEYNKDEISKNCSILPDRIDVIYHGISLYCCDGSILADQKEDIVLTVGRVTDNNLKRKGLTIFIKVAEMLPGLKFVLAGKLDSRTFSFCTNVPQNVQVMGFVSDETLHKLYRKAKVYAQLSYHEQFGCALAEAMAHKCVPVSTDKAAIPEVAGDAAYYVPYGDLEKTAEAIKQGLADKQKGAMARDRIARLFPPEKREKSIVDLVNNV